MSFGKTYKIEGVLADAGHTQELEEGDKLRIIVNLNQGKVFLKAKKTVRPWPATTELQNVAGNVPSVDDLLPPYLDIKVVKRAYKSAVDKILQSMNSLEHWQATVQLGGHACDVRVVIVEDAIRRPGNAEGELIVFRIDAPVGVLQNGTAHGAD